MTEPAPSRASRRSDRDEQRRRLLDAALDHLGERGYATLTLPEVARRAGYQPRVIRRHFANEGELVVASVRQLTDRRLADLTAAADDLPDDPAGWVDAAVDLLWTVFSGPMFFTAVELWVASRTDATLAAELYPAEQIMGHRLYEAVSAVLPPELRDSAPAHEAIWSSVYLMRGLAMRRLLREEEGHEERILAAWKQHLFTLIVTGDDPDALPEFVR